MSKPNTQKTRKSNGNAAAMREALSYVLERLYVDCNGEVHICSSDAQDIIEKIKSALDAPPRNADVGKWWDQIERHVRYCHDAKCECGRISLGCRLCFANWSLKPFTPEVLGA